MKKYFAIDNGPWDGGIWVDLDGTMPPRDTYIMLSDAEVEQIRAADKERRRLDMLIETRYMDEREPMQPLVTEKE